MAQVTLTFDNGPVAEVTPHVLDVLSARNIQASFFVIGRRLAVPEGRKATERAKAEGHWFGNHSYVPDAIDLGEGFDLRAAIAAERGAGLRAERYPVQHDRPAMWDQLTRDR